MEIEKHIKNLEKYCEDDIEFRSQTAEEEKSDFDIFCENHIADIKAVLQELKNTQSDLYEANNCISDLLDIAKQRDKIIDDMAEHLTTSVHSKEWVIKYFEERCKNGN